MSGPPNTTRSGAGSTGGGWDSTRELRPGEALPGLDEFAAQVRELRPDVLLRAVRVHQAQSWKRGERLGVEAYLARLPALADEELLVALVCHEMQLRQAHGEAPRPEEYLARFPQYGARLELQFSHPPTPGADDVQEGPTRAQPRANGEVPFDAEAPTGYFGPRPPGLAAP